MLADDRRVGAFSCIATGAEGEVGSIRRAAGWEVDACSMTGESLNR
jgi:hypothetical protein